MNEEKQDISQNQIETVPIHKTSLTESARMKAPTQGC